jgi:hypothetical protein
LKEPGLDIIEAESAEREESVMRFTPNNFQYNGRVALALLPSIFVVAGFGGKIPVGVMMVNLPCNATLAFSLSFPS